MKKFILILLTLFAVTSCYVTWVDKPELTPAYFNDEVVVCDSIIYNMNCQVYTDSAKMEFVKRLWITTDTHQVIITKDTFDIKKNSLSLLEEELVYSPIGFKQMLIEKNKLPRDNWWFMITPNMGISWYTFDKIFNKYIEDR